MNDRLSHLEHDINLLKRIELEIVESISLINQRTQLLSISPDVEELRLAVEGASFGPGSSSLRSPEPVPVSASGNDPSRVEIEDDGYSRPEFGFKCKRWSAQDTPIGDFLRLIEREVESAVTDQRESAKAVLSFRQAEGEQKPGFRAIVLFATPWDEESPNILNLNDLLEGEAEAVTWPRDGKIHDDEHGLDFARCVLATQAKLSEIRQRFTQELATCCDSDSRAERRDRNGLDPKDGRAAAPQAPHRPSPCNVEELRRDVGEKE